MRDKSKPHLTDSRKNISDYDAYLDLKGKRERLIPKRINTLDQVVVFTEEFCQQKVQSVKMLENIFMTENESPMLLLFFG